LDWIHVKGWWKELGGKPAERRENGAGQEGRGTAKELEDFVPGAAEKKDSKEEVKKATRDRTETSKTFPDK
jgi:hypothetical protein